MCSYNNICVRGLTAFKGAQGGRTNHQLRSSRDTPRYFQCKFRHESLVSIFIYGFNLGLISYLDFREMSPLPRGYMCKQQKFRIRGTKGLNRVLGVQIRGGAKKRTYFRPSLEQALDVLITEGNVKILFKLVTTGKNKNKQ